MSIRVHTQGVETASTGGRRRYTLYEWMEGGEEGHSERGCRGEEIEGGEENQKSRYSEI